MIIAVDFDGTLAYEDTYGNLLGVNTNLISSLIKLKQKGHKLILWSCRGGSWLQEAIILCKDHGLEFDSINENIKDFQYKNISCKVVADIYIDDKAITPEQFLERGFNNDNI